MPVSSMKPQMGLKEKVNVGIDETSKSMKLKESIRVPTISKGYLPKNMTNPVTSRVDFCFIPIFHSSATQYILYM